MNGQLAYIMPLTGSGDRPDNSLPSGPPPSIDNTLPPLPPLPPGLPPGIDNTLPPAGSVPPHPIFIPLPPNNTLPAPPPGTIWPPLNPGDGVQGPGWLLIAVFGADGKHKAKFLFGDFPHIDIGLPPAAQPK